MTGNLTSRRSSHKIVWTTNHFAVYLTIMKSVFDPSFQNDDVPSKIVFALERLSQVFRINLWRGNKKHGLSPLQIQVLLFLLYQPADHKRISSLAREFNMTKATISQAVGVLAEKAYLARKVDPLDSRSAMLYLTTRGEKVAREVSLFANDLRQYLLAVDDQDQETVLTALLTLIHKLQLEGHISPQRMCFTCRHFVKSTAESSPHYCQLMAKPLAHSDLRLNCLEHTPVP